MIYKDIYINKRKKIIYKYGQSVATFLSQSHTVATLCCCDHELGGGGTQ